MELCHKNYSYVLDYELNDYITKIKGEVKTLHINKIYKKLDLSELDCEVLIFNNHHSNTLLNYILPKNLKILMCPNNELTILPNLPNSLKHLYCYNNELVVLPDLPNSLELLYCHNNNLTELPYLPVTLNTISSYNNLL